MLADWLNIEPALVARLQGLTDSTDKPVNVYSAADLDGVKAAAQHTPAIHVLFDRYDIAEAQGVRSRANPYVQAVEQRWSVVVVVRNVRTQASGAASRADAGPLIVAMLGRLMGWRADDEHGPLTLVAPTYRSGVIAGTAHFAFTFTTRVQTAGLKQ